MANTRNKNQKRIKFFLLFAILIIIGVVTAVFVKYRQLSDNPDKLVSLIKDGASVSIGKVHQTSTRNGVKEWALDAGSVRYMNEKKQAVFEDLSLTFFVKDERDVHLKANQGILKTDSNDIEVTGDVVLKNGDYRLDTQELRYQYDSRVFSSKAPVKITGGGFDLVADSMSFDLNTNRTVFEGGVKGMLHKDVTL